MDSLDYARCTWVMFLMKIDGLVKQRRERWEHTRLIAYNIYCSATDKNRVSIYDYLPLNGDPTPAERKRAELKAQQREIKAAKKIGDKLLNDFLASINTN